MRAHFHFHLLLLALLLLSAAVAHGGRRDLLAGGWRPIGDVSGPHVAEIARFAVAEHNKEANARLALQRVVSGEKQVVSGVNYKLVLRTGGDGGFKKHVAVVWEKLGNKKLVSFKPIVGN